MNYDNPRSASSWGCELKYRDCQGTSEQIGQPPREAVSWNIYVIGVFLSRIVSLLVRLWVEIPVRLIFWFHVGRQPPREAVSWNLVSTFISPYTSGQPPREAVSWNEDIESKFLLDSCQPPREAVSWNICRKNINSKRTSQPPREAVSWNMYVNTNRESLSGQPPREAVSWNILQSNI